MHFKSQSPVMTTPHLPKSLRWKFIILLNDQKLSLLKVPSQGELCHDIQLNIAIFLFLHTLRTWYSAPPSLLLTKHTISIVLILDSLELQYQICETRRQECNSFIYQNLMKNIYLIRITLLKLHYTIK